MDLVIYYVDDIVCYRPRLFIYMLTWCAIFFAIFGVLLNVFSCVLRLQICIVVNEYATDGKKTPTKSNYRYCHISALNYDLMPVFY